MKRIEKQLDQLSDEELNSVAYFADYLSLQQKNKSVTGTCKYFFIKKYPINIQYLLYKQINLDPTNKYVKQALEYYNLIYLNYNEIGVRDFIQSICEIQASGMVDGERMLQYIYQYSPEKCAEKIRKYKENEEKTKYFHTVKDDLGNDIEQECTKYVYNYENAKEAV